MDFMRISPRMRKIFLVIVGLLCFPAVWTVSGQESGIEVDPVLVRVKGKVISAGDSAAVPFAHVVYTRADHRVFG